MNTRLAAAALAAGMALVVGGVNGNPAQSVYSTGVDLDGNGMGNLGVPNGPILTEDVNGNGVLDDGEDIDGDGVLDILD